MAIGKRKQKKYFTVDEANAMLPLLRSILRDVTDLANQFAARQERIGRLQGQEKGLDNARREELHQIEAELERDRARMEEFESELQSLGVELKDPFIGLVDWRALHNGHEVYLCWKLDEPEVAHWHELDAGFAGRQKLMVSGIAPLNEANMASLVFYSLIFTGIGAFFLFIHLMIGKLIRPIRPEADKLTIYECGEPTIGSAWIQFDLRYYVVALLFVIFDVEVAFLFPWAIVFGKANTLALTETSADQRAAITKELTPPNLPLVQGAEAPTAIQPEAAAKFAWIAMIDMAIFFGVLLVGFAYLWKRGDIDWVRSTTAEQLVDAQMPQPPTPASEAVEMVGAAH